MTWKEQFKDMPSMLEMYRLYIDGEKARIQNEIASFNDSTPKLFVELTLASLENLQNVIAGGMIQSYHVSEWESKQPCQ